MSHPITTSVTIIAGVANGVALAQGGVANTPLTLNGSLVAGGKVVFDAPRRVVIHSNGNDTNKTFAIVGTARAEQGGVALTEVVVGANAGDAVSTQDFATVTSVTPSANTAANVFVGTNGTASGPWVVWSGFSKDFQVSCAGYILSGAPTWQVDYTYDDPFGQFQPAGIPFPRTFVHPILKAETTADDGSFVNPIRASRLTLTAFGGAQLTQLQQGT